MILKNKNYLQFYKNRNSLYKTCAKSKKKLFLINKFIKNTNKFWDDHNIRNLDLKHKKILKNFSNKYKKNIELFSDEIIDWDSQSNLGAPFQLTLKNIKYFSFRYFLSNLKSILLFENYLNQFYY